MIEFAIFQKIGVCTRQMFNCGISRITWDDRLYLPGTVHADNFEEARAMARDRYPGRENIGVVIA